MAQTKTTYGEAKAVTKADALKSAQQKDAFSANFNIPAETDEELTLTGNFYEKSWERGEGKDKREGTILLCECEKKDGGKLQVPFGFFRTKTLREEDGLKSFNACFSRDASFEDMVNGMTKNKKIKVCRDTFVPVGYSSARDVTTVNWA